MSTVLNVAVAGLTAIGFILSVLGLRAWFRYGETRLALLFLAFLGFLSQGGLLTYGLFVRNRIDDLVVPITALSGGSLLMVYFATLGRSKTPPPAPTP